jgi:hypothetical protein
MNIAKRHVLHQIQLCKNIHDRIRIIETLSVWQLFHIYTCFYDDLRMLNLMEYMICKLKKHFNDNGRYCEFAEIYNIMIDIDGEYDQLLSKAINRL